MPDHLEVAPRRLPAGPFAIAGGLALVCALGWTIARLLAPSLTEEPQMRVGLVAVPEQEPLAIAARRRMLDPARVLVVELFSLQDLRNAFLDGNVHAGVFSLDEALRLTVPPVNARIEQFVGMSRAPYTLMTSKDFASVADLRGHRIGLEAGRRSMGALRELLGRAGLTLGDVELRLMDADSADLVLDQGQVDAVLVYTPFSTRLARRGVRALASWQPAGEGELLVLVSNSRAHRLAAGQVAHLADAWYAGARALRSPDSAATAFIARREHLIPAQVAAALAPERYLDREDDRRLRGPAGRAAVDSALAAVAARWRALGVPDTVSPPPRWLAPTGKGS